MVKLTDFTHKTGQLDTISKAAWEVYIKKSGKDNIYACQMVTMFKNTFLPHLKVQTLMHKIFVP